jgi:hypothetical protein
MVDKKRHHSEAKKRSFRLKNDPGQYGKETFVDRINEIKFAIKDFRKLYEKTPITDHLLRAKILKEIKRSKKMLSEIQVEYEMFKKYKMRTAICNNYYCWCLLLYNHNPLWCSC